MISCEEHAFKQFMNIWVMNNQLKTFTEQFKNGRATTSVLPIINLDHAHACVHD